MAVQTKYCKKSTRNWIPTTYCIYDFVHSNILHYRYKLYEMFGNISIDRIRYISNHISDIQICHFIFFVNWRSRKFLFSKFLLPSSLWNSLALALVGNKHSRYVCSKRSKIAKECCSTNIKISSKYRRAMHFFPI